MHAASIRHAILARVHVTDDSHQLPGLFITFKSYV